MHDMIYPCLTYLGMRQAMAELSDVFGLEIVWLGDDAAETRSNGGVAVAQTGARPEAGPARPPHEGECCVAPPSSEVAVLDCRTDLITVRSKRSPVRYTS
jgi:hypothetical protein